MASLLLALSLDDTCVLGSRLLPGVCLTGCAHAVPGAEGRYRNDREALAVYRVGSWPSGLRRLPMKPLPRLSPRLGCFPQFPVGFVGSVFSDSRVNGMFFVVIS